ncbi:MAG: hypothetical protein QF805_23725, partial [Pirellulaceae bacterium]|nr:hypothetical protein [Pirellulaceae bacterium]
HAVRLIIEERFGEMVCYHPPAIDSVPIMEAVNRLSQVNVQGSAVRAARALGISFGDGPQSMGPFHVSRNEPVSDELPSDFIQTLA